MSEGQHPSLQRCTSLKGLPSRRKRRENDHEHVAEKLQRRLPKFNPFSQDGVFGRDWRARKLKAWEASSMAEQGLRVADLYQLGKA